jgi:hypothetical protein
MSPATQNLPAVSMRRAPGGTYLTVLGSLFAVSLYEFSELLASAGFEIATVSQTRHGFCVVEARRR